MIKVGVRRGALTIAGLAVIAMVLPTSASAVPKVEVDIGLPSFGIVGESPTAGSLTIRNTSTLPHSAYGGVVTSIQMVPVCGSDGTPGALCLAQEYGAVEFATPAAGGVGSVCEGISFEISYPDTDGVVTLTPDGPVVLGVPRASQGHCTINFAFEILALPLFDVEPHTSGVQTYFNAAAGGHSSGDESAFASATSEIWRIKPDTTAPETTIDTAKIRQSKREASFTFSSNEIRSSFKCKLDKAGFKPCSSPTTYKKLKPGKHTFRVRAVDPSGNADPTPAIRKFTIKG